MESSGRLWEAVRLHKKGEVDKILISCDRCTIKPKLFYNYMRELGIPGSVFIFERKARNTWENATYTVSLLKSNFKGNEVLLITSAIHTMRSLACFARESFYPNWKTMDTWQSIFNEWIGFVVYKIMGYC